VRPAYLTGQRIYLRAMLLIDKEHAIAWHASPFPIDATRAEVILKEGHAHFWGSPRTQYAVVRLDDDAIIGGVVVGSWNTRTAWLYVHMAPGLAEADDLRAEVLRIAVPWLRDEREMMSVTVPIAADEAATERAAEELGMVLSVRLREHVARPGHRVDRLIYQALNPRWEVADA
jgi:RimJ/RimL family protein N-acetyltransferase